jgi:F-type H+/Na+-transporting ATPase subunit beta
MNDIKDTGIIVSIRGPVLDVEFPKGNIPEIYTALEINKPSENGSLEDSSSNSPQNQKIIVEVQQSIGNNRVRAVAMSSTDGLSRGMKVRNTGRHIEVPVGAETLGRIFDVLGHTKDLKKEEVKAKKKLSIHRNSPELGDIDTKTELFETGVKVIDFLCPFVKGGKIGCRYSVILSP